MSYAVENHATSGSHIRLTPGTIISNQYEVLGEAGSGNFARVFECRDIRSGARMAVKLMKPGYERDADFEMDVLSAVNKHDPTDTSGIVRFVEKITWNGYTGLAFTLKGKPLKNQRLPMNKADIIQVTKDIASSLNFLHFSCKAVHTDLKPENVLAEIDASKPQKWVLCDFGSASFYTSALDNDLITTRPYRAPEVVLKRGWNYHADTWSLGCILYELFTGKKLFDAQSDAEHLEVMQSRLGPLPASMNPRSVAASRRGYRPLKDELAHEPQLLQLIEKLLQYDPNNRPRCGDILSMPFLTGASAGKSSSANAENNFYGSSAATKKSSSSVSDPMRPKTDVFGTRLSTLTSSHTNMQAPAAVTKTSFSGLTAGSMYRLQQAQAAASANSKHPLGSASAAAARPTSYGAAFGAPSVSSSYSLGANLPHPSQLPKPSAAATSNAAPSAGGRGGIMSPAIPSYATFH